MTPDDIEILRSFADEIKDLKQRMNVVEENNRTLLSRQERLLRDQRGMESQYLDNMDLVEGRLAKIRGRLERLEGTHGR